LKHESFDKKNIKVGKMWGHFIFTPRAGQSVATEFGVDIQTSTIDARAGLVHPFTNDLTGKFKINSQG